MYSRITYIIILFFSGAKNIQFIFSRYIKMPSKKYRTYYSEKEKVYAIQEIKESIIALERDVTKIQQNLKRIGREICYLYNAMPESSESSSSESEVEEIVASECYKPVKYNANIKCKKKN